MEPIDRSKKLLGISWLILLALILFTGYLAAQEFRAKLTGRITDPSGAAVPTAAVQARNLATNEVTTAKANAEGSYTIPFLKPGNYNLSAEVPGFKKVIKENLVLNVGQTATINLSLELGAVNETVTVTSEIPLMETARADRGLVIDAQRVTELPLNARNPFMLANLSAGVNYNTGLIYQRPFDNGGIASWTVNGGFTRTNEFLLDGAPNNSQAGANNVALVPSVDAVQEFKIQTNSFDAQYGKTGGGIVNVTLKSGGNAVHGTVYEFAGRASWDADSFQNNAVGLDRFGCGSSQSPTDVKCHETAKGHFLDQYGFTVGGPIYLPRLYDGRNKSFFFYAYEGYREGTPTPLRLSYPAPEFLNGDFTNLRDNNGNKINIYDPATGRNVNGTWTRDPFPNNIIPANRLNPIALKLLSLYPKPNIPSAGSFYSQRNYAEQSINRDDFYNMMVRYDQNIGDNHRFFFRAADNKRTEIRPYQTISGVGADGQDPLERINHAYVADWVGTLKPTMIANLRVSWARYVEGARGDTNKNHSPAELGFPTSMVDQLSVSDWFGRYDINNYQSIGRYYGYNYTNTFAMNPNVTWLIRGHSIHAGLDYRTIVYNNQNPGNPFNVQATKAATQKVYNTADSLSGNAVASLLLMVCSIMPSSPT